MSYDQRDDSDYAAEPVVLFRFHRGTQRWLYTSADHTITKDFEVYQPSAISMGQVSMQPKDGTQSLEMTVPRDHEVAKLFRVFVPATTVYLTVFAGHVDEAEYRTAWQGEVAIANWGKAGVATIRGVTAREILKRNGLPYAYGGQCQHTVYRGGCQLSLVAHLHEALIQSISGTTITSDDFLGLSLAAGLAIGNGDDYRTIVSQGGNHIEINKPFPSVVQGDVIQVADGCGRSKQRCKELGNFVHYLAFNTLPGFNPFDSGLDPSNK